MESRVPNVFDRALLYFRTFRTVVDIKRALQRDGFNKISFSAKLEIAAKATCSKWSAYQITNAVRRASRLVPGATCLPQACAAQYLLSAAGYPSTMRVGIKKLESGKMEAHAWVIWDKKILLGGTSRSVAAYSVLNDYHSDAAE